MMTGCYEVGVGCLFCVVFSLEWLQIDYMDLNKGLNCGRKKKTKEAVTYHGSDCKIHGRAVYFS